MVLAAPRGGCRRRPRSFLRTLPQACLVLVVCSSASWAQLPDGPGKEITVQLCGNCHGAEVVTGYHMSSQGWTDTISKMIDQGAEGTEAQFNAVLAYLVKNFGTAPAKINVNTASAKDLEEQLALTGQEAAAIVKYRQDKGAYKTIDDLKKVPDLDFKKIEAKKDRLTF